MQKLAPYIDAAVVVLALGSGLMHPDPAIFYKSALEAFLIIAVPLFGFATLVYFYSEKNGNRIQGERKKMPPIAKEAYGTARAAFIVACMAAWPIGLSRAGHETGLVWSIEEMGLPAWAVVLQMYFGIVLVDAWTYWKHRFLHTKLFFPFHKHHHSFRDPTPFAGFAVGPVETLLTFWPLLLICFPPAKHFAPLYFSAIVGFVLLNLYLHAGVTFPLLERLLPRMMLNSSAWHNIHHSDVNANFGEVSFFWDKVCKTTLADMKRKKKIPA
jgi:lathosterol oxidase